MCPIKMDPSNHKRLDQHHSNVPDYENLNLDLCFELIFSYLDLKDLVSAADTNQQMRDAAELTFRRKYGKNFFVFYTKTQHILQSAARATYIDVREPKICFGVLRCFGHLIPKLLLDYYFSAPVFCSRLDSYVNKYSINFVTELEIYGYKNALKSIRKPFPKVEKLRLILCDLDQSSARFNDWFPKLRSLEFARDFLVCTNVHDQSCIAVHFPNLEHLSVHVSNDSEIPGFREENILAALKLNPQIRRLCLHSLDYDLPLEFVQKISDTCECLETLEINGYLSECHDVVHFKSVKTFSIFPMNGYRMKEIPFRFDALETFSWKFSLLLEELVLEFIQNNPSIATFNFYNSIDRSVKIENVNVNSIDLIKEFKSAVLNAKRKRFVE